MLKITITTTAIQTKSGVSSKTGKPYELREQPAWIHLVGQDGKAHPYPTQMMLMLERDQTPPMLSVTTSCIRPASSLAASVRFRSNRFWYLSSSPSRRRLNSGFPVTLVFSDKNDTTGVFPIRQNPCQLWAGTENLRIELITTPFQKLDWLYHEFDHPSRR